MSANNLSANTLFHFTDSVQVIESILKNKFYPRYCMENFAGVIPNGFGKKLGVPMVCFCDIPLSQIKNHISSYGEYAIGLSKDWAKKYGINPIMYEISDSYATSLMSQALENLRKSAKNNIENTEDIFENVVAFMSYLKKYEGNDWDGNDFNGELKRFYDEREWRYIPNYADVRQGKKNQFFINEKVFLNDREKLNEYMKKNFKLNFEPEDIKYIIVKDEKDVIHIQDQITKIFSNVGYQQVQLLSTRILTVKQILEDF